MTKKEKFTEAKEIKELLEILFFPNYERVENYGLNEIHQFSFNDETECDKKQFIEDIELCLHDYLVAKYVGAVALEEIEEIKKSGGYASYYFDTAFKSGAVLEDAYEYVKHQLKEKTHDEILEILKKDVE